MDKKQAIEKFVERDLNAIPQDWVRIIAEHNGEYPCLPMWGTMWIVDTWVGEKLIKKSRIMVESAEDIDLESITNVEERERVGNAIDAGDYLEDYIDEEMYGARCVLDKDGNTTALYVYEIDDQYVIGVNGAGWNFYDGVWDTLYDLMGLQWHTES